MGKKPKKKTSTCLWGIIERKYLHCGINRTGNGSSRSEITLIRTFSTTARVVDKVELRSLVNSDITWIYYEYPVIACNITQTFVSKLHHD